jgi:hypothetical protein
VATKAILPLFASQVQEILLTKQGREQDEFSQTVFFGEV